jgi:hypothetical protein
MDEVIGAQRWHGEYVCGKCGRFIKRSKLIGKYEQLYYTGEIRQCKCGNMIQINYRREMYDAG